MRLTSVVLALALLAGCSIDPPVVQPSTMASRAPRHFPVVASEELTPTDRAAVEELIDATRQVIRSDAFATRLAEVEQTHERLWLSAFGGTLAPAQVARIYLGRDTTVQLVPTLVTLGRVKNPVAGFNAGEPLTATITLPRYVLDRWRSALPNGRACAVNTLAHELTHAFSRTSDGEMVFTDAKRAVASRLGRALVSYTVGSVAQCTFLESERKMDGSFAACLHEWGTAEFNSGACDDPP